MTRLTISCSMLIAASVLALMLSGWHLMTAQLRFEAETARTAQVKTDVSRVIRMRELLPDRAVTESPSTDAVVRVTSALEAALLSPEVLREISPQGTDTAGALPSQRLRILLGPLTIDDLGEFLLRWQDHSGPWRTSSLSVTRPQRAQGQEYDVVLDLTAPLAADGGDT